MPRRVETGGRRSPAWWVAWGGAAVGIVAAALVTWSWLTTPDPNATLSGALNALMLLAGVVAFALSGAVLASRLPHNPIGWLLMVPGVSLPLSELGSIWLQGLEPPPTSATPVTWLVLWYVSWSWVLLIFPIFQMLLIFPDGRLLSSRWRLAVGLEVVMLTVMLAIGTFAKDLSLLVDDQAVLSVPNPIGFLGQDAFNGIAGAWGVGLLTMTVASVAAVLLRYRRGSPQAREQLKWPLAAIAFFGIVYGGGAAVSGFGGSALWNFLFGISIAFIPISVAVAVTRYRLYEIDRIISRTLGWAIVTGLLVVVFAAGVIGLQALLGGFTQRQTLAVAGSTLVAFALFQPLRRGVQRAVDRRFNRVRYDAERVVSEFAERLRDETDLPTLRAELRSTTTRAVQPEAMDVWLRRTDPA